MAFTDEELDEERQRIEDLRAEIAQAEDVKAREVQDASNEAEGKMLQAERERLEAQLAAINEEPAPVAAPVLNAGTPPVVEPQAAPGSGQQTPVPSSLETAKSAMKNSAEAAAKAETDKE